MKINNIIYNQSCVEGMKLIPEKKIDLIITDPPFAIDFRAKRANYNRDANNVLEGYDEIKQENYHQFTHDWIEETHRILKESGSMYVFSGWNNLKDVLNALDAVGFITINHLIWKYQFGVVTTKKFVTSHYHCLYVCKNKTRRKFYRNSRYQDGSTRYMDMEDVWVIKREYWKGEKKTPTKLPSELVRKIMQYSSKEGDLVFDPFLGSGQVVVIAKTMNRRYLGFETVKDYFDFVQSRLAAPQIISSLDEYQEKDNKNKKGRRKVSK